MEYKLPSLGTQDHTRSLPLPHFKQHRALSRSVSISEFTTFFKVSCAANFALVSADTNACWHFVNLPHKVQEPSLSLVQPCLGSSVAQGIQLHQKIFCIQHGIASVHESLQSVDSSQSSPSEFPQISSWICGLFQNICHFYEGGARLQPVCRIATVS